MRCEEIMKTDIECVTEKETVQMAARKMRDRNIGFLPVCDVAGRAIGTLTDRDITIRLVANGKPAERTPISEIMTKEVVACRPSEDVERVEALMGRHHKSRILVTDEAGKLVGVISLSDVADAEEDDERAAQTMREVSERELRP